MNGTCNEFAPIEVGRARELRTILNGATRNRHAVIINLDGQGVTGTATADLIAPDEDTNGLVRYQRHY